MLSALQFSVSTVTSALAWLKLSPPDNEYLLASSVGVVPGEPTDVVVTEATKSYVVLAWKPPAQRGHEGVMYYIEKVRQNVKPSNFVTFNIVIANITKFLVT